MKLGRLPFAVSAISVNWRDDERRAARVEQAAVELALLVREDPQPRDLRREPLRVAARVSARDAEQHAETGVDLPDDLARRRARAPRTRVGTTALIRSRRRSPLIRDAVLLDAGPEELASL